MATRLRELNLRAGANGPTMPADWDDEFDWPIPLAGGGELITFGDTGDYIGKAAEART